MQDSHGNEPAGLNADATGDNQTPRVFPGTEAIESGHSDRSVPGAETSARPKVSWAARRLAKKVKGSATTEGPPAEDRAAGSKPHPLPWDLRIKLAVVASFVILVSVLILNRGKGRSAPQTKINSRSHEQVDQPADKKTRSIASRTPVENVSPPPSPVEEGASQPPALKESASLSSLPTTDAQVTEPPLARDDAHIAEVAPADHTDEPAPPKLVPKDEPPAVLTEAAPPLVQLPASDRTPPPGDFPEPAPVIPAAESAKNKVEKVFAEPVKVEKSPLSDPPPSSTDPDLPPETHRKRTHRLLSPLHRPPRPSRLRPRRRPRIARTTPRPARHS